MRIENGQEARGIDARGGEGYISGSELQANMKRMDTSYIMPWNEREFRISFVYEQGSYK